MPLEELLSEIARQTGLKQLPFNAGCSDDRIRKLEAAVQAKLPDNYGAFLRTRNGQSDKHALTFPPDQIVFLSDAEVAALWKELQDYRDDQFFDELQDGDHVRAVLYHPGRIPIAQNESATAYLCLDFVPGPKGRAGQLVFNVNETDCVVVENSVSDLVGRYLSLLKSGKAKVENRPKDRGQGYWFTAGGRYIDWKVYSELKGDAQKKKK